MVGPPRRKKRPQLLNWVGTPNFAKEFKFQMHPIETKQNPKLVGGFSPTHLKNMLVKWDHLPKVRGENKKSLKPPASKGFWWIRGGIGKDVGPRAENLGPRKMGNPKK